MDALLVLVTAVLGASVFYFVLFGRRQTRAQPAERNFAEGLKNLSDLPSPPSRPFLGNLPEISLKGYHVCHVEWLKQYGDMFTYNMGPITVLTVANPSLIREFTMHQFKIFHDRPVPPTAAPISEKGLVFAKGNYWAGLRSSLTPSFHNEKNVAALYPHMLSCSNRLLRELKSLGNTKSAGAQNAFQVDILPLLEECALDVIGRTCFGEERWSKSLGSGSTSQTPASMYASLEQLASKLGAFTQFMLLISPGPLKAHTRQLLASIPGLSIHKAHHLKQALFSGWQAQLSAYRESVGSESEVSGDLITLLMRAKTKGSSETLTESDMVGALYNLIGAATNTTTTTLACALFYLAQRPDAQERASAEARQLVAKRSLDLGGQSGGGKSEKSLRAPSSDANGWHQEVEELSPTVEDLSDLPYIEAVIKEALRLSSPGAMVGREALEDTVLGGCFVPKGTPVVAPVYAIHQSEKYFPRAEEFLPERFSRLDTNAAATKKEENPLWGPLSDAAYFPFGLGPRMCLGQKYALLEAKLFLVSILARYQVRLLGQDQVLKLAPGFTLRPQDGVPLEFVPA